MTLKAGKSCLYRRELSTARETSATKRDLNWQRAYIVEKKGKPLVEVAEELTMVDRTKVQLDERKRNGFGKMLTNRTRPGGALGSTHGLGAHEVDSIHHGGRDRRVRRRAGRASRPCGGRRVHSPLPRRAFRRRSSTTCASASSRLAGPAGNSLRIGRRACSSRRSRRSQAIGGGDYDWRKAEARLNALPQFTTTIDGVDDPLHPRQVQARERVAADHDAWLAGLGDRAARDGRPADRSDRTRRHGRRRIPLVLPYLPGYGFSGEPTELGWDSGRIARAWAELIERLGYTRYVAQGGDVGALVTDAMGRRAAKGLAGIHLSLLAGALGIVDLLPKESEQERAALAALGTFMQDGFGYFLEQATRPQTIGYALVDSPIGLAAWMLDHDTDSYHKISRAFVDGKPTGNLRRDNILDNITLYWLTGTGASAARWYWEIGRPARAPPARHRRRSQCRSHSRRFRARSGLRRAAGSKRPIPASPTTTRSPAADTSRPGKSRRFSRRSCARPSSRCDSPSRARLSWKRWRAARRDARSSPPD